MNISETVRFQVRQQANFSCEFCGVTETDTGGELTIDHFRPQSRDGADDLDNLLYCCHRCNLYKADYWPTHITESVLWNPRQESLATHAHARGWNALPYHANRHLHSETLALESPTPRCTSSS